LSKIKTKAFATEFTEITERIKGKKDVFDSVFSVPSVAPNWIQE